VDDFGFLNKNNENIIADAVARELSPTSLRNQAADAEPRNSIKQIV
jgi:hypothetical protein